MGENKVKEEEQGRDGRGRVTEEQGRNESSI